jgi:hypothetical protein
MIWGLTSAAVKSGVPHFGQKRRKMILPLAAALPYMLVSPVTVKESVGKNTFTVPLPDAMYWQSRHQHTRVTIGSDVLSYRTALHKHPP